MDSDWQYIIHEFNMNYTVESFRNAYIKTKNSTPDDDVLDKLGYFDN